VTVARKDMGAPKNDTHGLRTWGGIEEKKRGEDGGQERKNSLRKAPSPIDVVIR